MHITHERIRPDQKQLLANLLKYYVYECCTYLEDFKLREDGRLEQFTQVDRFFDSPYDTYIVHVDQHPAGFVIVKTITESHSPLFIMEQFFITKNCSI